MLEVWLHARVLGLWLHAIVLEVWDDAIKPSCTYSLAAKWSWTATPQDPFQRKACDGSEKTGCIVSGTKDHNRSLFK